MKLNVRNFSAVDVIREGINDFIDEINEIDDEVIAAEAAYDAADEAHFYAHQEWARLDYFGLEDDEAWVEREATVIELAKARRRLIEAYENAGISPREMYRTEYEFSNDGTRIRRGYELTIENEYGYKSRSFSSFDAAMDTAMEMAYEAMEEVSYTNKHALGYIEKTTFDASEATGDGWSENRGCVTIYRHIALFDGMGWEIGTRMVSTTKIEILPKYLRY